MILSTHAKRQIRTALLLELNSCFTRISRKYGVEGSEAQQEFLQTLIASVHECVEDDTMKADSAVS
jgi:hypothetical protein